MRMEKPQLLDTVAAQKTIIEELMKRIEKLTDEGDEARQAGRERDQLQALLNEAMTQIEQVCFYPLYSRAPLVSIGL